MTYHLYPTSAQRSRLFHYLNVGRQLFNHALAQRIAYYKETGNSLSYMTQTRDLTILREISQVLADVPAQIEREALDRLDKAFKNFFRRVKEGTGKPGFPRFKAASRWNSFGVSQPGMVIKNGCKVFVSGIGPIAGRNVRQFIGKAKMLRVIFLAGKWFAKVFVDDGQATPPIQPIKSAVGIDVGLSKFASLSTGEQIENPRFYRRLERKLARAGRNVSRKVKGSKKRRKAVRRLQRVHARITNHRMNFTHHLSKRILREHQLIAVEKLNIAGMARSRLAKSILDAAWGQFLFQLAYKAEEAGCLFVAVNPRGTSQECSKCGDIVQKSLSVRVHTCTCGFVLDRDVNAAKNILQRALESAPGPGRGIGKARGSASSGARHRAKRETGRDEAGSLFAATRN
jgi:putative transposase